MSEERCEGCKCSEELEYHSCPYQREINENESEDYCNCCNECTNNAHWIFNMSQSAALLLEMRKHKTSHILHLILSILTCGIWVFVWILCAMSNAIENAKLDRQINKLLATKD